MFNYTANYLTALTLFSLSYVRIMILENRDIDSESRESFLRGIYKEKQRLEDEENVTSYKVLCRL